MKRILPLLFALLLPAVAVCDELPTMEQIKAELEADPNDESALYNAGLVSYLKDDFGKAVEYWEKLVGLAPTDWQAKSKLIQALGGAGKIKERDLQIEDLRKQWKSGKHPELSESEFFIRDQFEANGIRAFALEYYELKGERPVLWRFSLQKEGKKHDFFVSLGSYQTTTEAMRAIGDIGAEERAYHLDCYHNDGSHRNFGIFKGRPEYEEIRKLVTGILKDELKPMSSSGPAH